MLFVASEEDRDHIDVYRVPKSFAGIAPPDAYGGADSGRHYAQTEREAWGD
ncbi:MAG: hypothetical protein ACR2JC_01665 [Chloroflexota bacterium]